MKEKIIVTCIAWSCLGLLGCATSTRRTLEQKNLHRTKVNQSTNQIMIQRQLAKMILEDIEKQVNLQSTFKDAKLTIENIQVIEAFIRYKLPEADEKTKKTYQGILDKIQHLNTVLVGIQSKKSELNNTLNRCNSEPNSVDCDDGRWSINAGLMWNALTPDDGIENVDFAGAIGLNALYLSRWSESSFQVGVNPTSLPKFEEGLRGYGYSILRPEVSPFSISLERRHTPNYREQTGMLYGIGRVAGYFRFGAQRWTFLADGTQNPTERSVIALPMAIGWHIVSGRYSTRYHSRLKQKHVELGPNEGFLELYGDFTLAARSILGDVRQNRREIKGKKSPLEQKLDTSFLVMLGPEATAGLRFNKIFIEATYTHLMTDLWFGGNQAIKGLGKGQGWVQHVPGLTDGQFIIRVGLESELLSLDGGESETAPPTPTANTSVPKIEEQLIMKPSITPTELKAHLVKWDTSLHTQQSNPKPETNPKTKPKQPPVETTPKPTPPTQPE